MDLSSVTANSTRPGPQVEKAASGPATDYTMFLKMLTTQIKNQDPLKPIDSADYAVQLATFSGVEQQTRTNQLLEKMGGGFGAQGLVQLAGWVGREARTEGPVAFDGTTPVALSVTPRTGTDSAVLVATDDAGTVVGREDVAPGATDVVWSGTGITGGRLPPGSYHLSLESGRGGVALSTETAAHYARIVEVRTGAGGTHLILEGGEAVTAEEVTALRGS